MHGSPESSKAIFRRAVEVWAAGDISALDEVVAPDYIGHTSAGDRDLDGLRQTIEAFHKLHSQSTFHIDDQMIDDEKVISRMTAVVTMRDGGETVTLMGINISRVVDGKIVEEWNTWEPLKAPLR
jgi:predicted SnoaL-like aldol condensation-catalyzing enzyme